MAFVPLYDSIRDLGIQPSSVLNINRKKYEFYSACESKVEYHELEGKINANTKDGQFVKLCWNECICDRDVFKGFPSLCFNICESSGQIAFEEDDNIYRIVFPDLLEWKLVSFVVPHGVVPSVFTASDESKNTLAQSLHFYGIQPSAIVKRKSTGFTHLFYGDVQVKVGDGNVNGDTDGNGNGYRNGNGDGDIVIGATSVIYSSFNSFYLNMYPNCEGEGDSQRQSFPPFFWSSSGPVEMTIAGNQSFTVFPSDKFRVYYQIKSNNKDKEFK
jgi:hypothetical protein